MLAPDFAVPQTGPYPTLVERHGPALSGGGVQAQLGQTQFDRAGLQPGHQRPPDPLATGRRMYPHPQHLSPDEAVIGGKGVPLGAAP